KFILEKMDDTGDDSLLKQKLYISALLNAKAQMDENLTETQAYQKDVAQYEKRLEEYKKTENDIYSLVVELEKQKKELSQNYLQKVANKNKIENKLDQLVASFRVSSKKNVSQAYKNIELDLGLPLKKFAGIKVSKKGVSFKYKDVMPISATETGTIVYSGDLATYGKVIIVDHGNDIRSVFLGDMVAKVSKGDK